jgi:hypothetical protein
MALLVMIFGFSHPATVFATPNRFPGIVAGTMLDPVPPIDAPGEHPP